MLGLPPVAPPGLAARPCGDVGTLNAVRGGTGELRARRHAARTVRHPFHQRPVHKISIISRGQALGYTMALPETERVLRSKDAFEEEIAGLLGGRAAEELNCGGITTGAANDLERATALARAMVTQYGMSDELGLRTFASPTKAFPDWNQQQEYAEGTALKIDEQISGILARAYERAKATLTERWDAVARLAGGLLEQETLERPEIIKLLSGGSSVEIVPCVEESAA